jgi:hypothetical protein
VLRFEPNGPPHQGPPLAISASLEATVGEPANLIAWASDDAVIDPDRTDRKGPQLSVKWSKFRGPGNVTFEKVDPEVDPADGKTATTATFDAPGDYVLRLQANDVSGEGGGGFQCCWTNAHVAVTVKNKGESQ